VSRSGDSEISDLKARIAELEAELLARPQPMVQAPTGQLPASGVPFAAPAAPQPSTARRVTEEDPPIDGRYGLMVASVAFLVLALGVAGVLFLTPGGVGQTQQAGEESYTFTEMEPAPAGVAPGAWVYRPIVDPTSGDVTRTACVRSEGTVTPPPPAQPVRAELCLIDSEALGRNAYIALLGPGGFACEGDCRLWARFGSGSVQDIGGRSEEAGSPLVFLRDRMLFEDGLRDAGRTEVALHVSGGGVQQIAFNTADLAWEAEPATGELRAAPTHNLDQRSASARRNTGLNPIGGRQRGGGQGFQGRAIGQNATFGNQYAPIGQPRGQRQVVQGNEEPLPRSGEVFKEPRNVELMPGIQAGEGLIGEQPIGLAGQGAGDQNPSPFSAGEGGNPP